MYLQYLINVALFLFLHYYILLYSFLEQFIEINSLVF